MTGLVGTELRGTEFLAQLALELGGIVAQLDRADAARSRCDQRHAEGTGHDAVSDPFTGSACAIAARRHADRGGGALVDAARRAVPRVVDRLGDRCAVAQCELELIHPT